MNAPHHGPDRNKVLHELVRLVRHAIDDSDRVARLGLLLTLCTLCFVVVRPLL